MKCKHLPEMKPLWNLLWYVNGGKPREPIYSFGPVVSVDSAEAAKLSTLSLY
jgi:hypothetical protein